MDYIVIYKSNNKCGYRPQMFKEWTIGTKINCNGEMCEIIDIVHNDWLGIKIANQKLAEIRKEWRNN